MEKPQIAYSDFDKLDIRIGTILECEEVAGSEKLLKFQVDLGDPPAGGGQRTILAGVKKYFDPKSLIGLQIVVLANLEPKRMMGIESQGMILMAVHSSEGDEGFEGQKISLLVPQGKVPGGTGVE